MLHSILLFYKYSWSKDIFWRCQASTCVQLKKTQIQGCPHVVGSSATPWLEEKE